MKKIVKVVLSVFLFAVVFSFLYSNQEKQELQQLLTFSDSATVEVINGGKNHGSTRNVSETDRAAILAELQNVAYAPFHSNRPTFDNAKEYHYITVTDGERSYHFSIFADDGYGAVSQYCFTYSDTLLSLLRGLPFQP